jgi:RNA polymerase sigma-70 factor (ECF subfamily)
MPTDRNLIHQTLKGNPRSFDTLVQKYQPVVYARARLIVRNPQDAEDLTQEVFIKAYQNLPKLRDASRFAGWLSRIVKNVCVTWIHQQKEISKSCPMDGAPILSLPSAEVTPEQFLMKKELNQTILKAINSLPAVDGAVAHDFYIDHLSYDEISEKRGLSHRAIAS